MATMAVPSSASAPLGSINSNRQRQPIPSHAASSRKQSTYNTLRKESDYNIIQPIKSVAASIPSTSGLPSSTTNTSVKSLMQQPMPPVTPDKGPSKKPNKNLCATPPIRLYDHRRDVSYERGDQLGSGGFARCFLVQNTDGQFFASKTVAKKSLIKESVKRKFLGEISVHKMMDHPNIVKFVECFEDTTNVYVILELCSNKSLMEMVKRRGRITEAEARFFLIQILGALKYMHGKRVIHRDLKLGNIFLDSDMNVKIGDFGLAAALVNDDDRKTTICGTPNYIAPEILSGATDAGHGYEVDLWSVGIILYAMLVGRPPFQSKDLDTIYSKIKESDFDWPTNIPVSENAKNLVEALLNKDPAARPSIDQIACHAFFKSGTLPLRIPSDARKYQPTRSDLRGNHPEIRSHYYTVAKNAGVGSDERGRPFPAVGGDAGRSVQYPPAAQRPKIPAQMVGKENKARNDKLEALKEGSKEEKHMLPEALSPRDGHARMRNTEQIEKVELPVAPLPTSRGGLDGTGSVPQRAQAPKRMVAPLRMALAKMKIGNSPDAESIASTASAASSESMRTAVEAQPTKRYSVPKLPPVFSRRPSDRPSSSESEPETIATKAEVKQEPARALQPRRSVKSFKALPAKEEEPVRRYATRSSRRAKAEVESVEVKEEEQVQAKEDPNKGTVLAETNSTSVMRGLSESYRNLRLTLRSRVAERPTPRDIKEAVASNPEEFNSSAPYVVSWVDYSNAHGVGYMLSSGALGTLFNDRTHLTIANSSATDGVFSVKGYASESSRASRPDTIWTSFNTPTIDLTEDLTWERRLSPLRENPANFPSSALTLPTNSFDEPHMDRKTKVFHKLSSYIIEHLDNGASRRPSPTAPPFLMDYQKVNDVNVFCMSNGQIQFNFVDHKKLIISLGGNLIRIIVNRQTYTFTREDVQLQFVNREGVFAQREVKEKLELATEIIASWVHAGRIGAN